MSTCPCGFGQHMTDAYPGSSQWHREHKPHHLTVYPRAAADPVTVENLDDSIRTAEEREAAAETRTP